MKRFWLAAAASSRNARTMRRVPEFARNRMPLRAAACDSPKRNPARDSQRGGVSGTLVYGFGGDCWRAPLRKHMGGPEVPLGTSGSNRPYGMRSWMCRITAVSVLGIETRAPRQRPSAIGWYQPRIFQHPCYP